MATNRQLDNAEQNMLQIDQKPNFLWQLDPQTKHTASEQNQGRTKCQFRADNTKSKQLLTELPKHHCVLADVTKQMFTAAVYVRETKPHSVVLCAYQANDKQGNDAKTDRQEAQDTKPQSRVSLGQETQ